MNLGEIKVINKLDMGDGYVLPNKTNFIEFINSSDVNSFASKFKKWLPDLKDGYEDLPKSQRYLKIYQLLVSNYLQEDSPYRGLLLFHGLGAGKTAASITTAEGYINRNVMILLPASIKKTFKSEVNLFTLYNKKNYWWNFCNKIHIDGSDEFISYIKYTNNIEYKKLINNYFYNLGIDLPNISKKDLKSFLYKNDGKECIGVWIADLSKNDSNYDDLEADKQKNIDNQVHIRMEIKYDYFSYNGSTFLKKIIEANEDNMTKNKSKSDIDKFKQLLNKKKDKSNTSKKDENHFVDLLMSMNNPFDNKTVIIDEVHNFISKIKNNSRTGTLVYRLLMKAQNVRLIFLSATPAINEPFELSIMINLLNGYTNEYLLKISYDKSVNVDLEKINDIIDKESTIDRYETLIKLNSNTLSLSLIRNEKSFSKINYYETCDNYPNDNCRKLKKSVSDEDCNYNRCNTDEYIEYLTKKLEAKSITFEKNIYSIFPDITQKSGHRYVINKQTIENASNTFRNNYIKIINDKMFINNERDFIKRTLGCISYFEGIDIDALREKGIKIGYPSKSEYIMTSKLSDEQYEIYKYEREEEIQKDMKKKLMIDEDIPSSFRSTTRQTLLCIYDQAIMEIRRIVKSDKTITKIEITELKKQIIDSIKIENILKYSPKYNNVINILNTSSGPALIYSNYYSVEGLSSLTKYMSLSGYSEYNFKEDDLEIKQFDEFIDLFRESGENLLGKMVIYKSNINSQSYLNYCKYELNLSNKDEISEKIIELKSDLEELSEEYDFDEIAKLNDSINFLTNEDLYLRGKIKNINLVDNKVEIEYLEVNNYNQMEINRFKTDNQIEYKFNKRIIEKNIDEIFPATFVVFHSGIDNWQKYIKVFNDIKNKYGQYISAILATDVIAEGINLSYIRQVNIINPFWNKVKTNQVIGRATRMKSHLDLQYHQKHVEVFHHIMEFTQKNIDYQNDMGVLLIDRNLTTDQYLFNIGIIKEDLINQFLKVFKEVSIDCDINQSGDFMKKSDNINCVSRLNDKIFGFRYNVFSYNLNNLIMDEPNYFLGMPTNKTFVDCNLNKFLLENKKSFHIFKDSQFYYNFYKFIFSSSFNLNKKYIINLSGIGLMKSDMSISEINIPDYELLLWNWLDSIILETIESISNIENIDKNNKDITEYVYKLLCNFNNPMISDHICNIFKLKSINTNEIINEPLVNELIESTSNIKSTKLCYKIKYEVISKLYDIINIKLPMRNCIKEVVNIDLFLNLLKVYRETDEYYTILLKLFKTCYGNDTKISNSEEEVKEEKKDDVKEEVAEEEAKEVKEDEVKEDEVKEDEVKEDEEVKEVVEE